MTAAPNQERVYGGRSLTDRRLERRNKLCETGLKLFAQTGYANVTVAEICKTAGTSSRQFYEEFRDRQSLLLAIYDSIQNEAQQTVSTALSDAEALSEEVLVIALGAYISLFQENFDKAKVVFIEVVGVNAEVTDYRYGRRQLWVNFLRSNLPQLQARQSQEDDDFALKAFLGAVNGTITEWITSNQPIPAATVVSVLSKMLQSILS